MTHFLLNNKEWLERPVIFENFKPLPEIVKTKRGRLTLSFEMSVELTKHQKNYIIAF